MRILFWRNATVAKVLPARLAERLTAVLSGSRFTSSLVGSRTTAALAPSRVGASLSGSRYTTVLAEVWD